MSEIDTIIAELGGASDVARAIGAAPNVVSEWKRQQSIPVKRWPALIALARKAGKKLNAERLLAANVAADALRPVRKTEAA